MSQKRVMLIANKWWEADPPCWVLFHDKAHPRVYAQNTAATHNAAIALAWLLPDVIGALPD